MNGDKKTMNDLFIAVNMATKHGKYQLTNCITYDQRTKSTKMKYSVQKLARKKYLTEEGQKKVVWVLEKEINTVGVFGTMMYLKDELFKLRGQG